MKPSRAPAKILIVEDERSIRQMLVRLLQSRGYNVVTAPDGQAGLEVAKSECPDLIISDLNMPCLDGIDMIQHLRKLPEFCSVPIIVFTVYDNEPGVDALQAGANEIVIKPMQIRDLIEAVNRLLG